MLSSILSLLQSLFYPHYCPGCGTEVRGKGVLCDSCRRGIWHPRALQPLSLDCLHLDGLFFLMDYAGGIQKALQMAKFQGREDLLPRLAEEWKQGTLREKKFHWQLGPEVRLAASLRIQAGGKRGGMICRKKSSSLGAGRRGTGGKPCWCGTGPPGPSMAWLRRNEKRISKGASP